MSNPDDKKPELPQGVQNSWSLPPAVSPGADEPVGDIFEWETGWYTPKCTCGVNVYYGKEMPKELHSDWCDIKK